jgi:hypothetical protein
MISTGMSVLSFHGSTEAAPVIGTISAPIVVVMPTLAKAETAAASKGIIPANGFAHSVALILSPGSALAVLSAILSPARK